MPDLKSCPFCGCSMKIHSGFYPNGSRYIEPRGWHDLNCPLDNVIWCFDVENGWTEKAVTKSWNRREGEDG